MSNKKGLFFKNTAVIFASQIVSQFSNFILIPLATNVVTTKEYGEIDLIQIYISLFLPVLILRIDSAFFRFLIEKRGDCESTSKIIRSGLYFILSLIICTTLVGVIILNIIKQRFANWIILNLVSMMVSTCMLQILRGIGETKKFAIITIIGSILNILLNTLLLYFLKIGVISILISSAISNAIISVLTILKVRHLRIAKTGKSLHNKKIIKEMLIYSIPLIPDYLSGWIINVSDRSLISIILGLQASGVYSVTSKISNILNSVFVIYNTSWHEMAVLWRKEENNASLYSKVINESIFFFSNLGILFLPFISIIFPFIVGKSFREAYIYIPILVYSNIWRVVVGLMMGIYIAYKKSKEVFLTTMVSAIINIVINVALIGYIGLYAACISTLIAYAVMAIYRLIECRKIVDIKFDIRRFVIVNAIFFITSIAYYINNFYLNLLSLLLVGIYFILTSRKYIKEASCLLKKKTRNPMQ